jgi:hypothetical protein
VELAAFTPGGARVRLVLRIDRMRGTRWLAGLDSVVQPMPDYQAMIQGTKLKLGAFDVLLISSPEPDQPQQTFLAARVAGDQKALIAGLTGSKQNPRVTWEEGAGGMVGRRAKREGLKDSEQDPRVFLVPTEKWILLARPEHVEHLIRPPIVDQEVCGGRCAAEPPDWLEKLTDITDESGSDDAGPIVILGFSVNPKTKSFKVPGLVELPAPLRGRLSMTPANKGMLVAGVFEFVDEATAKDFAERAENARVAASEALATKFLLDQFGALRAMDRLRFEQVGANVSFSMGIPQHDADQMMRAAASWVKDFFEGKRKNR